MDRKHGYSNVDIRVFVVDMISVEDIVCITEHLKLTGLFSKTIHSKGSHDLVQGFSGGFIVVKKIASKKNHIDLGLVRNRYRSMQKCEHTSWDFASCMTSSKLFQLSSFRIASRSP